MYLLNVILLRTLIFTYIYLNKIPRIQVNRRLFQRWGNKTSDCLLKKSAAQQDTEPFSSESQVSIRTTGGACHYLQWVIPLSENGKENVLVHISSQTIHFSQNPSKRTPSIFSRKFSCVAFLWAMESRSFPGT